MYTLINKYIGFQFQKLQHESKNELNDLMIILVLT